MAIGTQHFLCSAACKPDLSWCIEVPLFHTLLRFYAPLIQGSWRILLPAAHFEVFTFSSAQNRRHLQSFPRRPHYKSSYHYTDVGKQSNTLLLLLYGTRGQTRAAVWFVQTSTSPSVPRLPAWRKVFSIFLSLQEIGLAFLCRKSVKHCYRLWNPMFSQRKYLERKECILCLNTWRLGAGYLDVCSLLTSFSLPSLCLNYILNYVAKSGYANRQDSEFSRLLCLYWTTLLYDWILNASWGYVIWTFPKWNRMDGKIKYFIVEPLSLVVKGRMNAAYEESFYAL